MLELFLNVDSWVCGVSSKNMALNILVSKHISFGSLAVFYWPLLDIGVI